MSRLTFPPRAAIVRQLRADVRKIAAALGASGGVCDSLALIVDELVNNAVEHGSAYRHHNSDLEIRIQGAGDRVGIEFFDPEMPNAAVEELDRALAATANGMPSLENERGRGLFLLSVYLDDLRVQVAPGGGLRLSGTVARK